jgi:hypothetical protein
VSCRRGCLAVGLLVHEYLGHKDNRNNAEGQTRIGMLSKWGFRYDDSPKLTVAPAIVHPVTVEKLGFIKDPRTHNSATSALDFPEYQQVF